METHFFPWRRTSSIQNRRKMIPCRNEPPQVLNSCNHWLPLTPSPTQKTSILHHTTPTNRLWVFPSRHQIGKWKDPHEIKVLLCWVFPAISCNNFDYGQLYRGSVGYLCAHLFRKLLQLFIKEKAKIFTNAFLKITLPASSRRESKCSVIGYIQYQKTRIFNPWCVFLQRRLNRRSQLINNIIGLLLVGKRRTNAWRRWVFM